MFNRTQFTEAFPKLLARLTRVEKMSKEVLMPLSRDLLLMLHSDDKEQGDIGYINRTIAVLSPANKKVFVLFMKEYTGFICNDDGTMFVKKSKKHYAVVQATALIWLADPLNNFYSWVNRQKIEATKIEFNAEYVTSATKKLLAKAKDNGMTHAQVLEAMFEGGLTIDDLIVMLDHAGKVGDVAAMIEEQYMEVDNAVKAE